MTFLFRWLTETMGLDEIETGDERDAVTELLRGGVPIHRDPLSALHRAWHDGRGMTSSRWLNFIMLMEGFHDTPAAVHRLAQLLPPAPHRARCPAGPALGQWLGRYVREGNRELVAPHLRVIAAAGAGADLYIRDLLNLFPRTNSEGMLSGLGSVARQFLHGGIGLPPPAFIGAVLSTANAYPDRDLQLVALALKPCPELWIKVLFASTTEILATPELRAVAEELKGQGSRTATESEEETVRALVSEADLDTAFCRNGARAFRILREIAPMTSGVGAIVVDETLRRTRTWDIPELTVPGVSRDVA